MVHGLYLWKEGRDAEIFRVELRAPKKIRDKRIYRFVLDSTGKKLFDPSI